MGLARRFIPALRYGHKIQGHEVIGGANEKGRGRVFWVVATTATNFGTFSNEHPPHDDGTNAHYATTDAAINATTASVGDVIYVTQGHTETVSAAAGIAADVAGISIVGLGVGNNRPQITFGTAASATMTVSANNIEVANIIGVAGLDLLTNPFNVTGNDCLLDLEWQDASTTVEALRAIRLDTADGAIVKLVYKGFTGGDATANAIRLDDCDNVRLELDAFGRVDATGWVEMVDVASTNVYVKAKTFTQAITNGSRNVIDTITGSTWYAEVDDMSAGARYTGGSAAALASDDVSTINANHNVPSGDATTNTLMRDVVGNKTDAAQTTVGTTRSLMGYLKGVLNQIGTLVNTGGTASVGGILGDFANDSLVARLGDIGSNVDATTTETIQGKLGTDTEFADRSLYDLLNGGGPASAATAAAPANNVSIHAAIHEIYDQQDKAVTNTTAVLVSGTTIFTIAGGPIEIVHLSARCVTANDGTASTLQWSCDATDGAATTFSAASASLANAVAGASVVLQGTTLATAPLVNASGAGLGQQVTNAIYIPAGIITTTIGVGSTTGTWQHHMRYRPLSRGVSVS